MSALEYLLGEITVDPPSERDSTLRLCPEHKWPEGYWGVADEQDGYIAYFQHEDDAYAFRLFLINARLNSGRIAVRYAAIDKGRTAAASQPKERTTTVWGKVFCTCGSSPGAPYVPDPRLAWRHLRLCPHALGR